MLDGPIAVSAYLDRIAYSGPTSPTIDTLCQIHRAHLLAVPFENLDIGLQRPILCEQGAFVRKIVEQRRGGFCYELNGAFAALLREVGFQVTLLSARVARKEGGMGPEFDHLTLRVDLDEPWLADVGFGDSFLDPLPLRPDGVSEQIGRSFRLIEEEEVIPRPAQWHMEELVEGAWKPQYWFTLRPRQISDFAGMCRYHQTSPESHFTRKRVCTLATEAGRISLIDMKRVVKTATHTKDRILESEEEWQEVLHRDFGVEL